jgi:hypothetical protein
MMIVEVAGYWDKEVIALGKRIKCRRIQTGGNGD